LLVLLIVSAAVYFTLTGVSLEYDIDAVYRLETYAANESGKGTNSLALVYLDKDDLEHVKKGDKVIVSLYRNGIKSTYEGTVTSEKYKKEKVYSSAFAALTAGPEDLPTSFKYTLPVRFKGTDTLFNNTLMAGSSISLGKVKIHRYIVIAVKALLPA
ncbi:MAG: hypothetical protein GY765_09200, partial [bacterium]|nr:hypothetical protein [bacterium]